MILAHNANRSHTYKMAVNHFADLTSAEFVQAYMSSRHRDVATASSLPIVQYESDPMVQLPSSVDWRKAGIVGPVKDQGQCGSCWAFSTVCTVESAIAKRSGVYHPLSEQELVDCDTKNSGCDGGFVAWAYEFVSAKGLVNSSAYPYTAVQKACSAKITSTAAKVRGYVEIPAGNEGAMKEAVASAGVISVAIDASTQGFQFYSSGVFSDRKCTDELNHAVNVVGYGTLRGQSYWLVRNSWSATWGMDGYILMARNKNMCGIANEALYPLL